MQRSDSVEILPNERNGTILLSDDDENDEGVETDKDGDERMMPPPNFIPITKKEKPSLAKSSRCNSNRTDDEDKPNEPRPVRSTRSKQPKARKVWRYRPDDS